MHSHLQTDTIIGIPLDAPNKDTRGTTDLKAAAAKWAAEPGSGFKIKLVSTRNDRESISMLVNQCYSSRGYASSPIDKNMNLVSLQATIGNQLVGTLSVQFDADGGLPLDHLYRFELDSLRRAGQRICQFTKLAVDKDVKSKAVLASLFHVATIWAFYIKQFSYVCIEVNPRHVAFYQRMLDFMILSDVRDNLQIQAPSVLLGINLEHMTTQVKRFGGKPEMAQSERSFYPYFFSPEEEMNLTMRLRKMNESYV